MRSIEERIEKLIEKNRMLRDLYGVRNLEDFRTLLGSRYESRRREELMSNLSDKEKALVREYYLRTCDAGVDRFPACIEVTIDWQKGASWRPIDRDYYTRIHAIFDRISRTVKYHCVTRNGLKVELEAPLDEAFEEGFFTCGEAIETHEANQLMGRPALDADCVSIDCQYGKNASPRVMEVGLPAGTPFEPLYEMSRSLFERLIERLVVERVNQ